MCERELPHCYKVSSFQYARYKAEDPWPVEEIVRQVNAKAGWDKYRFEFISTDGFGTDGICLTGPSGHVSRRLNEGDAVVRTEDAVLDVFSKHTFETIYRKNRPVCEGEDWEDEPPRVGRNENNRPYALSGKRFAPVKEEGPDDWN